jgi:hypothetical protein
MNVRGKRYDIIDIGYNIRCVIISSIGRDLSLKFVGQCLRKYFFLIAFSY